MIPRDTLAQLRVDYHPAADGGLDAWAGFRGDLVQGDCVIFALALAWRLAGRSWPRFIWHLLSRKTAIWRAWSAGAGRPHAVLYHRGAGFADNLAPTWASASAHRLRYRWPFPAVIVKLALGPLFLWLNCMINRAKGQIGVRHGKGNGIYSRFVGVAAKRCWRGGDCRGRGWFGAVVDPARTLV